MIRLQPTSPRRAHASRFGAALAAAMHSAGVSNKRLSEATGCTRSAIACYRAGQNLPQLATAALLSEALGRPSLLAIVREARTFACERCGRGFLHDAGSPRRFCSPDCREIARQLGSGTHAVRLAEDLRSMLAAREHVKGGLPKAAVAAALARWSRSESHRVVRQDATLTALAVQREAVEAMCVTCSPELVCRDGTCPLRPVSPLPRREMRDVAAVRPPQGSWSPEFRDKTLAAIRTGNATRWSRPGAREEAAAKSRAYFAAMTPAEREAHRAKISAARRKEPAA